MEKIVSTISLNGFAAIDCYKTGNSWNLKYSLPDFSPLVIHNYQALNANVITYTFSCKTQTPFYLQINSPNCVLKKR